MATFKAVVQDKRKDGTYQVKIRITHNRSVRRLPTNLFATPADLTRSLKIKNDTLLRQCEGLIAQCRDFCNSLGFDLASLPIDELTAKIKNSLQGGDKFRLDFFEYTKCKITSMNPGTAKDYTSMLNALQRHIKRDYLDVSEINVSFLRGFESFLGNEPSMRGHNRKGAPEDRPAKGGRAVSKYLTYVRAIHNKAKDEFNDEDQGIIKIPLSPFKKFKIKPQPKTRKRALTAEGIQALIDLPYDNSLTRGGWNRFNLAKDCFLLSFALLGMNSADMYHAPPAQGNVLAYNRRKTEGRRDDNAEMHVLIEDCIKPLMERYADLSGKRLFNFYQHYSTTETFNAALNKGLKKIGELLHIDDLQFYAARHSMATIARSSKVGIEKATVHEMLNHTDPQMKVTDIYIDRDWNVIWEANKKLLALFRWP